MKEEFLKLESYEEFNERRNEFEGLEIDKDIIAHMGKIFPKLPTDGLDKDGNPIELYEK